jgi:hypothetical protein
MGKMERLLTVCGWVLLEKQVADPAGSKTGKPQLDLLDFDDLSIEPASASPAPSTAPSSNGVAAKPSEQADYLSRCAHLPV